MADVAFLSPHLDDAILSCGARIMLHVALGDNVTIVTVFSEGDNYAGRQAEDKAACAALGARHLHLGFNDAPFRDSVYQDFSEIVFGHPTEADRALVGAINANLMQLEQEIVYAPLGAGTHIDHRLVCAAASPLHPAFYEDRPYALWPGILQARLNSMRIKHELPDVSREMMEQALSGYTFLKAFVPEGMVRIAMLPRYLDGLEIPFAPVMDAEQDVITGTPADTDKIWNALSKYESQIGLIYSGKDDFVNACSHQGTYYERLWRVR
jgi:LmbE family N-acetylglucosaminyl deacetylase